MLFVTHEDLEKMQKKNENKKLQSVRKWKYLFSLSTLTGLADEDVNRDDIVVYYSGRRLTQLYSQYDKHGKQLLIWISRN